MYRWKVIYFFSWLTSLLINRFKNPLQKDFRRILVIRHDEIGDMITALPVFDALRKKFAEAEITVWCYPLTRPLIENHPAINQIVVSKTELRGKYDLIIDLRGNFETIGFALSHFPYYRLDRGTVRFKNKFALSQHPHEVFTNLQIIEPVIGKIEPEPDLNLYLNEENHRIADKFLSENGIKAFVLLHTGARKKLRQWPQAKFAKLSSAFKEKYGWETVIAGTSEELSEIEKLQSLIPYKTFAFTGYSLTDFAALASKAKCFVGNESGPMHIAAAMKIPVVGLFGPGEPHTFSPFGKKSTYIHHKLKCNPCDQIHCVQPNNPCINLIEVEEVLKKAEELLRNQ
jgi:ADP-heptose:LPS heptosyltransferase